MKAYIAIGFANYKKLYKEIEAIKTSLSKNGIIPWIFVENYFFEKQQEKEMMNTALADIACCDLFIAESSEKAIGVGIEAGYAKALGKTVVYIRHIDAEHSTTLSGISNHCLLYSTPGDLSSKLNEVLNNLILSS